MKKIVLALALMFAAAPAAAQTSIWNSRIYTAEEYVQSRALSKLRGSLGNVANVMWMWDDFSQGTAATTPVGWIASLSGTGAGALALTDEGGGVHQATSGATAASSAYYTSASAVFKSVGVIPGYFAFRMKVTTAIDAAAIVYVGVRDVTTTKTITCGVWGPNSTATFRCQYDGNETGSFIDLVTPIDTAYHLYEVWWGTDAKLHVSIDQGPDRGNVTMSAAPANSLEFTRRAGNGATAAARTYRIDYLAAMAKRN